MMPSRRWRTYVAAATLVFAGVAAQPVSAQQYPAQDIHLVCGFAPGSGADVIVRFIAEKMRPLAGRSIIVENKVGAGGNIATEYVARAKPDGYTVYITGATALAAAMHIMKNPSVDVGKALQVVGTINKQPVMVAVGANSPYKSIAELTAAMKAKGDKASYALANPTAKVVGAMYKEKAGLQAVEVFYKTGAEYLNDLGSGVVDYAIPDNVLAMARARAGTMRILAVSTAQRMQAAPDYPTMTELGYPMDLRGWWAGLVPTGTPKPVVDKLNEWISQIVASEDGKKFLATIASDPWVSKSGEAQTFFLEEIKQWGDYVRIAKIEQQG
jgi:tripartite-type tricarboxylate transporter receptor subunit TctC